MQVLESQVEEVNFTGVAYQHVLAYLQPPSTFTPCPLYVVRASTGDPSTNKYKQEGSPNAVPETHSLVQGLLAVLPGCNSNCRASKNQALCTE